MKQMFDLEFYYFSYLPNNEFSNDNQVSIMPQQQYNIDQK